MELSWRYFAVGVRATLVVILLLATALLWIPALGVLGSLSMFGSIGDLGDGEVGFPSPTYAVERAWAWIVEPLSEGPNLLSTPGDR